MLVSVLLVYLVIIIPYEMQFELFSSTVAKPEPTGWFAPIQNN